MHSIFGRWALPLAITTLLLAAPAGNAAPTFEVTRADDPAPNGCTASDCSLREAVGAAATSIGSTVHVPALPSPYIISNGRISTSAQATITGDGAATTTISGDPDNGLFLLNSGSGNVTFQDLTLTGGNDDQGGAAVKLTFGAATLRRVIVRDNVTTVTGSNATGGGLRSGPGTTLTVIGSTIRDNQAKTATNGANASGGGIDSGGTLVVTDSTLTGNLAAATGSPFGTSQGGAITATGTTTITNSTISGNSAGGGSQGQGGAIFTQNPSGVVTLDHATVTGNTLLPTALPQNADGGNLRANASGQIKLHGSIVSAGSASGPGTNCATSSGGTITSLGDNLEDHSQCGLLAGDAHDTDPLLLGLASNGGPTKTHALRFDSPARGSTCSIPTDQRGLPRTGGCDIGAFQYQGVAPVAAVTADPPAAETGQAITFDATTSTDADPGDALSFAWAFDDGATATGATASHVFATPGAHTATATVTDPTNRSANAVAAVTVTAPAVTPPAAGGGAPPVTQQPPGNEQPPADTTAPVITRLRVSIARGITFGASEAAGVTFRVERVNSGRRSGARCVAPSRSNRGRRACTRIVVLRGAFTLNAVKGSNRARFTGRLAGRALAPGSYRLVATPRDAAGNAGRAARVSFTIVKR